MKVSNGQTDRIYLATEGGTIQCLRELEQITPVAHNESHKQPPDDDWTKPTLPKLKPKTSDDGTPKVAHDRPAPKKIAKKDAKKNDVGFDDAPADKPAKPPKGKAPAGGKAKADVGKKDAPAAGGDDPFGVGK